MNIYVNFDEMGRNAVEICEICENMARPQRRRATTAPKHLIFIDVSLKT